MTWGGANSPFRSGDGLIDLWRWHLIQHYFLKGVPISRVFKYSPEALVNKSEVFLGHSASRLKIHTILREDTGISLDTFPRQTQGVPPLPNIPWDHCLPPRSPSSFCRMSPPRLPSEIPKLHLEGLLRGASVWIPGTQTRGWGLWHQ